MKLMVENAERAIAEEDRLRAACYRLLARFLAAPPDAGLLTIAAGLDGDDSPFGQALTALATAARHADPQRLEREYHNLFIGVGRGELVPFGSYYLAGFLNEKPLARLRQDMAALGIARAERVSEPEDHAAAVLEMMAGLIEGEFGADPAATAEGERGAAVQRRFFETHLASWLPRFFADLEAAEHATLYRAVGAVGRCFMAVETAAITMED